MFGSFTSHSGLLSKNTALRVEYTLASTFRFSDIGFMRFLAFGAVLTFSPSHCLPQYFWSELNGINGFLQTLHFLGLGWVNFLYTLFWFVNFLAKSFYSGPSSALVLFFERVVDIPKIDAFPIKAIYLPISDLRYSHFSRNFSRILFVYFLAICFHVAYKVQQLFFEFYHPRSESFVLGYEFVCWGHGLIIFTPFLFLHEPPASSMAAHKFFAVAVRRTSSPARAD